MGCYTVGGFPGPLLDTSDRFGQTKVAWQARPVWAASNRRLFLFEACIDLLSCECFSGGARIKSGEKSPLFFLLAGCGSTRAASSTGLAFRALGAAAVDTGRGACATYGWGVG